MIYQSNKKRNPDETANKATNPSKANSIYHPYSLPLFLMSCGFEQVNEGYLGIKQVWGKVEGINLDFDEQAKQKVKRAQAEAESMRIRSQALSQNKSLVSYEAVQKWDGSLPKIILGKGSMPMLDLKNIMESK